MDFYIQQLNNNITNIVVNEKYIYLHFVNVNNKNICGNIIFSDFKHLKKINCSHNKITNIVNLPDSLIELNCSYNKISSLPNLPENLIKLYCQYNNIIELNNLPIGLKYLGCSNNDIIFFDYLPNSIEILNISHNPINNFCDLPNSIKKLYCKSDKNLLKYTDLNNLPKSISLLRCNKKLDKLYQELIKS
jgi:hypothetical protein